MTMASRPAQMPEVPQLPAWRSAIDVHHHVVPEFYGRALADLGYATSLPGVAAPAWSPEVSLAMMERQGIRAAIVNVWPGVPAVDAGSAAALATRVNEYLASLVAAFPSQFGAFAILPLPHVEVALAQLAYALDVLRLDGIGLVTNYGGVYIADRQFDPIMEELARRRTPVFVHPTMSPAANQPMFGLPGSLCEFPFETVRVAAQLLYNGTLDRFGDLRLILSHGGGGVPYLAERLTYGPIIDPRLADRLPGDPIGSLRNLYYDIAMAGNPYSMPSLTAFVPESRILMGSDFPFMPEWSSTQNARAFLDHCRADPDSSTNVEHMNAAELFPRLAQHLPVKVE